MSTAPPPPPDGMQRGEEDMITEFTRGRITNQETARALEDIIGKDPGVSGRMVYGYPLIVADDRVTPVDAVLVSDTGHVTVFDLAQGPDPGSWGDRQDRAWNIIRSKLGARRELTRRRDIIVPVQTVTFWPEAPGDDGSDPERPLMGPNSILDFVRERQAQPHEDVDPQAVMDAIMFVGEYEW